MTRLRFYTVANYFQSIFDVFLQNKFGSSKNKEFDVRFLKGGEEEGKGSLHGNGFHSNFFFFARSGFDV